MNPIPMNFIPTSTLIPRGIKENFIFNNILEFTDNIIIIEPSTLELTNGLLDKTVREYINSLPNII